MSKPASDRSASPALAERIPATLGLLTSDLMVSSRVRATASQLGLGLRQIGPGDGLLGIDLLLVDLNRDLPGQLARLAGMTGAGPLPEMVAFGPHMALLELRSVAQGAGVRRVVANSALPQVLKMFVKRREAGPVVTTVNKA